MRFAQRSVLMADPNWNKGFYYDGLPPHTGMKLARQIATITYRSGPEWDQRFGRKLRPMPQDQSPDPSNPRVPALCPDFLIETYLDYQGEQFCLKYDANSLIYISKAMDLFDMTASSLTALNLTPPPPRTSPPPLPPSLSAHPSSPRHEYYHSHLSHSKSHPPPTNPPPHLPDLAEGFRPLTNTPVLVLGVQSDILFSVEQQREVADALRMAGNQMTDTRVASIEVKIKKLDGELGRYKEQMSKLRNGPGKNAIQERALRTLKQRRMYESQLAQLAQQTFNMESAALATENLRNTMATVDAMKLANKEMRKQYGKIDIDKIESVQYDMEDLLEQANEIQETLGRSYAVPDEIDEADLEAELDALQLEEEEEGASYLADLNKVPDFLDEPPVELADTPAKEAVKTSA
ncbi:hypothetical protein EW026_g3384 [Hermanssonia centrifuga]|uniref:Uncharacterized protein n=1 Tax=Hermanssonia centrifuga TaxID=98765 RepID=A0A4S4KKA2_9APHY|nr:hypothetical protein EW026_g3384 [Hermanssonia centrifuga]